MTDRLNLVELPDVAIDEIWRLLSHEDHLNFRLVSKMFCVIANPRMFSSLTISDLDHVKLKLLPTYGRYVKSVSMTDVELDLNWFEKYCRYTNILKIKRVNVKMENEISHDCLQTLSIDLDDRQASDKDILVWLPVAKGFRFITNLSLIGFDPVTAQTIFYNLKNLIHFKYESNGSIIPKSWKRDYLKKLDTNFDSDFKKSFTNPNLRSLYIKNFHKFSLDESFINLNGKSFPNLIKIHLALSEGYLFNINEYKFPRLNHIYVNYREFSLEMLSKLIESHPRLYYLHSHKVLPNMQIPLETYIKQLPHLTKLYLDISNSDLDLVMFEELPILPNITHLGFHFKDLNKNKLQQLMLKFPKVYRFEFIGAVMSNKELAYELTQLHNQQSDPDFTSFKKEFIEFPWIELVVPDFNQVLIAIIKLAPSLKKVYHRFRISDIPVSEVNDLLKYSNPNCTIEYLPN